MGRLEAVPLILVDTCVVIWLAESRQTTRLSRDAVDALSAARRQDGVAMSVVTLYELAWLVKNNRLRISTPVTAFLQEVESRFVVLPINSEIARLAQEFPTSYPKDPMDRIIGATALDRGVSLLTPDRAIRKSKAVPVIW